MSIAIALLSLLLIIREIMFMRERLSFNKERQDLYNRIQAGSLSEYQQADIKPSASSFKTLEQKVSEETHRRGITRSDLQYPSHWKG